MKILLSFLFVLLYSLNIVIFGQDLLCGTTGTDQSLNQTGGLYIPSQGTLKVLIVFARFKDDNSYHNYWPAGSPPPNYQSYIDPNTSTNSTNYLNLTNYFKQMSMGNFHVIGQSVYVETPNIQSYYGSDYYKADKEILQQKVDPIVNFSDYDNWTYNSNYNFTNQPDGTVDMIVIVWRGLLITTDWIGISDLGRSTEYQVENGTKTIKTSNTGGDGSGVTIQSWGQRDESYTFHAMVHEIGHWLLGRDHPYDGIAEHSFWGILRHSADGICANAYERERLGWITPINITGEITNASMSDFITTGISYKFHPANGALNENYYFENHQKLSIYDNATQNGTDLGVFILHQQDVYNGTDNIKCRISDGEYNWENPYDSNACYSQQLPVFRKLSSNRFGFNNRDFLLPSHGNYQAVFAIADNNNNITCHGYEYGEGSNNAFNVSGKRVFAPWSNPSSHTWDNQETNFEMQILSQNGNTINAHFYLGNMTITENTVLPADTYNINGNLTVAAGATLTIQPGVILNFNNGSSLLVNGALVAIGTSSYPIIFKSGNSSPGSWGPLTLNGAGANGSTIQYANILYGKEIDIVNANNVTIQNCNITNSSMHGINFSVGSGCYATNNTITNTNTAHGIYIQNGASVTCNNNVITRTNSNQQGVGIYFGGGGTGTAAQNDINGFSWGIGATWGSSPTSYNSTYSKNNRIINCSVGLEVYYNSFPIFGTFSAGDRYGGNSINNNFNAAIGISYPSVSSGLYGCGNWWGSNPPNTALFYVATSSYFYYNNYLSSDPWVNQQQLSIKLNHEVTSVESAQNKTMGGINNNPAGSSNDLDSLFIGMTLLCNNKSKEAKDFFISYLNSHSDNQAAYTYLFSCADNSTILEIINFFNSLPSKAAKEQNLLLSYLYLKQGNIDLAKKVNDKVNKENLNTSLGVRAKLNNFYIALYNDKDLETATSLLNEVKTQADLSTPMEIMTAEDALSVYNTTISASTVSPSPKQIGQEVVEKPTSYSLSQNYPNPFNPTTTIKYQIPISGFVTLKIYDILGNQVATLVNENKDQGFYNVNFDASKLSSGVYIYQIKSNDYISSKKMMLLK
jgi:hypothetical protein